MSAQGGWYYAQNGQSVGPMSLSDLIARLPAVGGDRLDRARPAVLHAPG